ncbi:MAG: DUF3237 domain-containing protein [Solirubrobacterales bacterium]|nr:DUF3237 domain-containing protein [Solirubrobacterales bacterium]
MPDALAAGALAAMPLLDRLPVEHLCDLSIDLEPPQLIPTPRGNRVTYIVRRGTVAGPRLAGEVLPGGGDWLVFGDDGAGRLDVRATIRTGDGALIHLATHGVVDMPPEAMERWSSGERVGWDRMYTRSTLLFDTADERYRWLDRSVTVAVNELARDHVDYRVYRVL